MIIGHAPAGYITAKLLYKHFSARGISPALFSMIGIIGALIPDLDMFYFYFVDNRQHHHHTYFPHFPIVWLSLLMVAAVWVCINRTSKVAVLAFLFCLCGFSHLILDSIVGDVWWFAPFIDRPFSMFTVPALYKPWWLNFILHWSFAVELFLWVLAIWMYRKQVYGLPKSR